MADFNQTPSGQASVSVAIANLSLAITGNGISLFPGSFPNNYIGATATFDLSGPAPVAGTGMYPSWRRSLRIISDD